MDAPYKKISLCLWGSWTGRRTEEEKKVVFMNTVSQWMDHRRKKGCVYEEAELVEAL